ncbi:MAG: glycosyltransferase family 1 protein [Chloroflexota bacterium]|jgi:glycosyltransferase involved in cell wall biosynthesis
MHIGIDSRLPYYQVGGISAYVVNLVAALAQLDSEHRFTVFHSRKDRRDYVTSQMDGFDRANLWTPCHHRLERWTLGAELLRYRLNLLHSPDFIPPACGARFRIITVHDLNFLLYPEFLTAESRRYYNQQIEWAVGAADHILADSHHTRRDLIERLAVEPKQVTTVHLAAGPVFRAVHSAEDVSTTLAQLGLAPGFILFVGTLSPRKNVKTILAAFELLVREEGMETKLVLAGARGWLADELFASLSNSAARDRIVHVEGLTDREMAHLYAAAGVLAIPSLYEGFGLPALEAMHCGCPVIASNRASLPEVVGEAGILLEPTDVAAWAASIGDILHDSAERQRLIALGQLQAQKFSWSKTAAATMAVYERCLR